MALDNSIPGTGVFSVDPAAKKLKRTRASASKVRTGCLTWFPRARHVKCDEEKPSCNRCRKDKHKCDGYAEHLQAKRRPSPGCLRSTHKRPVTSVTQLTPRLMFHHVHRCTVPDFGLATPLAKIWSNYILPLGYYSDPIKHAVIALGVAHRAFLENPFSDPNPSMSAVAFGDLAEEQYRKAVTGTIEIMADPSPVNIRITLISCLVFVCFEIVRGQYDKAVQHLRAGSRILESLHQAALASQNDPKSLSAFDKRLAETVRSHFSQLCDITNMFVSMGMDASMLIEADVIPDLTFFTQPEEEQSKTTPFSSVFEARLCLHRVERMLVQAFEDSWYCSIDRCWHSTPSCGSHNAPTGSEKANDEAWETANACFEAWGARFELFQQALPDKMEPADLHELKALRFSQKSWVIFNAKEGPCALKSYEMAELHRLVDMAEDVESSREEERSRPKFALAADIVPSLAYICAFCDNVDLERRIIDVLRRMKRREGVWDSQEMANLYEMVLQAKLGNQWKDEYNWETLPNLARMMSNLAVSTPSGNNLSSTPLVLL
ncbi:C6 zinc finger domain-containing protein [Colletotrichum navitas]|uniref:C6 zinc finger domain-containing protein n=1 Tax=Colletotrichum navitas TaxID=681940 RepID=A0AAD8PZH6_9PEZI|nr:C6 zinc finger domain-containing protein [Colletotrichum navitas]KAK1590439.1 C6 zinc finger domain-containing protein [Colletotrichum navitas]